MPTAAETSPVKTRTWYSKVQAAFRPFHKPLVVLGAAIVFLTYVYKDIRTDQAKDAVASLKMAELEYEQLVDHDEVMASLRLQSRFAVQREGVKPTKGKHAKEINSNDDGSWGSAGPPTQREVWEMLSIYVSSDDAPDLEAADLLRAELPSTKTLDETKLVADADQKRLKCMVAKIPDHISYIEGQPSPPASENDIKLLNDLPQAQEAAEKSVRNYIQEVVRIAQEENSNRRVRLEKLSRTTTVLFVIGWIIGLLGKLFDTQEKKDEDEVFPGLSA